MANRRMVKQGETGRINPETNGGIDETIPDFDDKKESISATIDEIPALIEAARKEAAAPAANTFEVSNVKIEERKEPPPVAVTMSIGPAENGTLPVKLNPPVLIGERRKNVFERIKAVMEEVQYIQRRAPEGGVRYATINYSDVLSKIRPSMLRHGLELLPGRIERVQNTPVKTKSGDALLTEITQWFRAQAIDCDTDYYEFMVVGSGQDSQDKGAAKAGTMAQKQALLKLFLLEVGDELEDDYLRSRQELPPVGGAEVISAALYAHLQTLCREAQVTESTVATAYGVQDMRDLSLSDYNAALARLEARKANIGNRAPAPQ